MDDIPEGRPPTRMEIVDIVWVICLRYRPQTRVEIEEIVKMVEIVKIMWMIGLRSKKKRVVENGKTYHEGDVSAKKYT